MFRIGHARDIHRLELNRKLVLGLVTIPYEYGLSGHSDADCLTHAIAEAIIGALGLGDLGTHFPDTSNLYKDISSKYFLVEVLKMMETQNFEIVNLDSTILIEKPILKPFIPKMKESIANVLKVDKNVINIKATRGEKIGFVGKMEGVEADCVVLLKKKD